MFSARISQTGSSFVLSKETSLARHNHTYQLHQNPAELKLSPVSLEWSLSLSRPQTHSEQLTMIHKDFFLTEEKDVWVWRILQAEKPKIWVSYFDSEVQARKSVHQRNSVWSHTHSLRLSHTHSLVQWTQEASIAESLKERWESFM